MLSIADFSKYESYKDSGVDWLDEIPYFWEEKKLKFICTINGGGSYGSNPEVRAINYPVATTAQITSDGEFVVDKMPIRGFSSEEVFKFLCKEGDILVVKSSGSISNVISGKAGIVGRDTPPFVFSNFLLGLRVNRAVAVPKYIYYLAASYLTKERVKRMVSGSTYPNLQVQEYISARMPVAPYSEQLIISAFLDKKTTKIDEAIAIKEQQIALLNERKQIIIQKAVTQGLDPTVPMKDSGVDWIGEIPAHWEVENSKWMFKQRKERARRTDEQLTASQKYGVVSQKRFMEIEGRRVTQVEFNPDILKHVEGNDFVISMRSFQGGIEYCPYTGCVSSAYVPLIPGPLVNSQFFKYLLKCGRYIEALQSTSNLVRDGQALRYENFCMVPLPVVPINEQAEIAGYIEKQIEIADNSIRLMESQIEKLKEYKTTLINSVVTGKIRITPDMVEG